jgi:GTP-binding protein Era
VSTKAAAGGGSAAAHTATRFGFAAIIGAPNAGKSTLVNMLVGAKVTIVSHKVQTTRMRVRGIYIEGGSQVVLIDTPGIFAPRRRLDRAMVEAAWASVSEADAVALIVDAARGVDDRIESIAARLKTAGGHKLLILNKIDRLASKEALLGLASRLGEATGAEEVFMVSALTGDGVDAVRQRLAAMMPEGPWHYPADDITDLPLRMLAAEITREKMLQRLHDELPYAATVETTGWKELRDGSVRIEQTLYVERDGQKKIVLGKGGATIKQISSEARAELKDILERNVHLFLFVKVRGNWGDDPERYREMGLEFPKD